MAAWRHWFWTGTDLQRVRGRWFRALWRPDGVAQQRIGRLGGKLKFKRPPTNCDGTGVLVAANHRPLRRDGRGRAARITRLRPTCEKQSWQRPSVEQLSMVMVMDSRQAVHSTRQQGTLFFCRGYRVPNLPRSTRPLGCLAAPLIQPVVEGWRSKEVALPPCHGHDHDGKPHVRRLAAGHKRASTRSDCEGFGGGFISRALLEAHDRARPGAGANEEAETRDTGSESRELCRDEGIGIRKLRPDVPGRRIRIRYCRTSWFASLTGSVLCCTGSSSAIYISMPSVTGRRTSSSPTSCVESLACIPYPESEPFCLLLHGIERSIWTSPCLWSNLSDSSKPWPLVCYPVPFWSIEHEGREGSSNDGQNDGVHMRPKDKAPAVNLS